MKYGTYSECGVCKVAVQEKLEFLVPYTYSMDYAMTELKGAKLLRTQTLGNGGDCCDFTSAKKVRSGTQANNNNKES